MLNQSMNSQFYGHFSLFKQDYQRHITVLKESLCAKEEHYTMLQADVEELRTRMEEKNRLIEKKTKDAVQAVQERNRMTNEMTELKDHMDIKDRKINVLQRKVSISRWLCVWGFSTDCLTLCHFHWIQIENLEDLLKEKDNQVEMHRARLSAMQAHHCSSEGALYSLEEAIGDKDKQMLQLREQRDRAEKDKEEERDLHEREVTEYKLKLHALECDIDKLNSRLDRVMTEKERLETRLESSQSELGKSKAELDRASTEVGRSCGDWEASKQRLARLELENERLRHDLERSQVEKVLFGNIQIFCHQFYFGQHFSD